MKRLFNILVLLSICELGSAQLSTFRNTYGGAENEHGRDIEELKNGDLIITGSTGSFGYGQSDVYLLKINANGDYLWSKSFGGNGIDWGMDIDTTYEGGYVIAGYSNSFSFDYDCYIVKTNTDGDTLWTKTIGGNSWDFAYSIEQTADSGFIVVGETYSFGAGEKDGYVIKLDKLGDTLWTKTVGGLLDDSFTSVKITSDTNYIIAGYTENSVNGGKDFYAVKMDANGNVIWEKHFGDIEDDIANEIIESVDSTNYLLFGTTTWPMSDTTRMSLYFLDLSGNVVSNVEHGFEKFTKGNAIAQNADKFIAVAGSTANLNENFLSYVLSSSGIFINGRNSVFATDQMEEAFDIEWCSSSGIVMVGTTNGLGMGLNDVLVIKTNDSLVTSSTDFVSIEDTSSFSSGIAIGTEEGFVNEPFTIFPNPVNNYLHIAFKTLPKNAEFTIVNAVGQIQLSIIESLSANLDIDLSEFDNGIYFYQLRTDTNFYSGTITKL